MGQPDRRAEKADNLHPVVEQTRQSFSKCTAKPGEYLQPREQTAFSIFVTSGSLERTFHVLDTLMGKLDARGYPPTVGTESHHRELGIMVGSLAFRLHVQERRKPIKHVPTQAEQRLLAKNPYTRDVPKHDHEPTGRLVITSSYIYRQSWADWRASRLEDALDSLADAMVSTSLSVATSRAEAHERQRQYELAAAQRRKDEENLKVFKTWMTNAQESRELKAFVAEIRAVDCHIDSESNLGRLLAWADEYADRIDPLRGLREDAAREQRDRPPLRLLKTEEAPDENKEGS